MRGWYLGCLVDSKTSELIEYAAQRDIPRYCEVKAGESATRSFDAAPSTARVLWRSYHRQVTPASYLLNCSAARCQVDDCDNHRDHQQHVNKASRHFEAPSEQPQHQQNRENCPKHRASPVPEGSWPHNESFVCCVELSRDSLFTTGPNELLHGLEPRSQLESGTVYRLHLFGSRCWQFLRLQRQLRRKQYARDCFS